MYKCLVVMVRLFPYLRYFKVFQDMISVSVGDMSLLIRFVCLGFLGVSYRYYELLINTQITFLTNIVMGSTFL